MHSPDKIVLEHAGALGDFLLAWPVFLSLARHYSDRPVHFAGPSAHARWLAPWTSPCPPALRRALDARFAGEAWPDTLAHALVVRPGLAVRPDLPDWKEFWFLAGVAPGRAVSPRQLYREALSDRGVSFVTDFAEVFRTHFGRHAPASDTALLFPGAGHRDKAWPLESFEYLAQLLRHHDIRPVFVLGPAERERGLIPAGGEIVAPEGLPELSTAIRAARFVVGSDCGPMHLAGMHGVPGLALFGPTAPVQWGPIGMEIMTAGMPCSPCTGMTSGEFAPGCPRPLPCLAGIRPQGVLARLGQAGLIPGCPERGQGNRAFPENP